MILDSLDKVLLYELELDSSVSVSRLAKKLRRSKEVVGYRLQRLIKEGILVRCSAIVDMSRLGYLTFRIYIRWQNMTEDQKKVFCKKLGMNPEIWTVARLHGKWDIGFFIGIKYSDSINQFHNIWSEIQLEYKEKIAESKIAIYAPVHNFNKRFFIEGNGKIIERIYGAGNIIDFDEIDEKLVKVYASDVRQSFTEIAKKLNLSVETVRQRIRKLEKKKVIVGYKVDLNMPKMGFQGYRIDFILNSTARNKEMFEYIKRHKFFYQINNPIGGGDFETEIVVRDLAHLLEVIEEVVSRFCDVIRNYEYMGYSGFPKLTMVPD